MQASSHNAELYNIISRSIEILAGMYDKATNIIGENNENSLLLAEMIVDKEKILVMIGALVDKICNDKKEMELSES